MNNENNSLPKRKNIVVGISLVVALCIVIASAMIYTKEKEKATKEITYNETVGVHVKGAVNNSGYYEVPRGTRIKDLEGYVGGFKENALLDGVNLAAYVEDGQEIYFPHEGNVEDGALNLNLVTEEELVSLVNGIGEESARKIIEYRTTHGQFTSVLELDEVLGKTKAEKLYGYFYIEK